jgi:hypothetical protein
MLYDYSTLNNYGMLSFSTMNNRNFSTGSRGDSHPHVLK